MTYQHMVRLLVFFGGFPPIDLGPHKKKKKKKNKCTLLVYSLQNQLYMH